MGVMQSGTQMVKLKAGSKGLVRLFYLDDHRSCIRWRPSRKSEKAKSEYAWAHSHLQTRWETLWCCIMGMKVAVLLELDHYKGLGIRKSQCLMCSFDFSIVFLNVFPNYS